jgi:hypothetical protein
MLLFLLLASCGCDEKTTEGKVEQSKEEELTPEQAKKALLSMDAKNKEFVGWLVRLPNENSIVCYDTEGITPGLWCCNLKRKSFQIVKDYPNAPRHNHNYVCGVFQKSDDGSWVATVTESWSADR